MKTRLSLVREMRTLFGAVRLFTLAGILTSPLFLIPAFPLLPFSSTTVRFDPTSLHTAIQQDFHPVAATVELTSLQGVISLKQKAGNPALDTLKRQAMFPALLYFHLLWFAVSHVLWRLCRNVELGQIFNDSNLKDIQVLGIVLIARPIVGPLVRTWVESRVSQFVVQHASFDGLKIVAHPSTAWGNVFIAMGTINLSELIPGLLLLVLVRVFRQGLALQREAELTV